jgi:uncharacterized membrane protein
MRAFIILKASRRFGPMLEILQTMLREVKKFMVIESAILFIFWSSGRILFFDVPEYESNERAIATLLSASVGNFDYGNIQPI